MKPRRQEGEGERGVNEMTDLKIKLTPVSAQVKLLHHTPYPLRTLYTAYRTCYSNDTPQEIDDDRSMSVENMLAYLKHRMNTEHTSPLEHVSFTFAISDVSRTFTHQFVRHRVGLSISQQSGRYTAPKNEFRYVRPVHMDPDEWERYVRQQIEVYQFIRGNIVGEYDPEQMGTAGVREDTRMLLPGCQATNLLATINFTALQHMCDIRLCSQAQWEFRHVVAKMRAAIKGAEEVSWMAKYLGPKCLANRRGICDEDEMAYDSCGLQGIRPHRDNLYEWSKKRSEGSVEDYMEVQADIEQVW